MNGKNFVLVPTSRCNFTCPYCILNLKGDLPSSQKTDISLVDFQNLVQELIRTCAFPPNFYFTGGECTLRQDCLQYLASLGEAEESAIRIYTNGSIPIEENLFNILNNRGKVQASVSIDTPKFPLMFEKYAASNIVLEGIHCIDSRKPVLALETIEAMIYSKANLLIFSTNYFETETSKESRDWYFNFGKKIASKIVLNQDFEITKWWEFQHFYRVYYCQAHSKIEPPSVRYGPSGEIPSIVHLRVNKDVPGYRELFAPYHNIHRQFSTHPPLFFKDESFPDWRGITFLPASIHHKYMLLGAAEVLLEHFGKEELDRRTAKVFDRWDCFA